MINTHTHTHTHTHTYRTWKVWEPEKQIGDGLFKYIFMENLKNTRFWDFPGGPVAKTLHSSTEGPGSFSVRELDYHMPQLKVLMQPNTYV